MEKEIKKQYTFKFAQSVVNRLKEMAEYYGTTMTHQVLEAVSTRYSDFKKEALGYHVGSLTHANRTTRENKKVTREKTIERMKLMTDNEITAFLREIGYFPAIPEPVDAHAMMNDRYIHHEIVTQPDGSKWYYQFHRKHAVPGDPHSPAGEITYRSGVFGWDDLIADIIKEKKI